MRRWHASTKPDRGVSGPTGIGNFRDEIGSVPERMGNLPERNGVWRSRNRFCWSPETIWRVLQRHLAAAQRCLPVAQRYPFVAGRDLTTLPRHLAVTHSSLSVVQRHPSVAGRCLTSVAKASGGRATDREIHTIRLLAERPPCRKGSPALEFVRQKSGNKIGVD